MRGDGDGGSANARVNAYRDRGKRKLTALEENLGISFRDNRRQYDGTHGNDNDNGNGSGDGNGYGYDNGYGYGSSYGYGNGNGDGDGGGAAIKAGRRATSDGVHDGADGAADDTVDDEEAALRKFFPASFSSHRHRYNKRKRR